MKKLICSLLTLSLALSVLTAAYTEEETDIDILRAADVNADRMINVLDLVLVAGFLGETPTEDQTVNPDVNGDGTVNILDLVLVASYIGETVRPPVAFVSVDPAVDAEITVNDSITLTFDNLPEDVTVSEGVVTITDNTVSITGPFAPGTLALMITWADGSETLNYTVRQPADFVSAEPEISSELIPDDSITLMFDHPPEDVTVSEGVFTISDNTVTITGPFTPGALALTITWADGSETLNYTVRQAVALETVEPTTGTEITVNDSIILTFDHPPEDVTVSEGVGLTTDNTVTITGPFTPGTLALTITWADGSETLNYTIRQLVAFESIDPTVESQLNVDDTITLTFDNPPKDVTVNEGDMTITDNTVSITGPFTPGTLKLIVTWADGSLEFTYEVAEPDTEAPSITSGTIGDGDEGVDSSSTLIEIEFSEEVNGTIALQTEAGDDVGWVGEVAGNKAKLELVKGKELDPETTYIIAGKVEDTAGNETDISITFVTASAYDGIPIEVTDADFDTVVLASEVPIVVDFYKDG
ncbi:dockerin type I repeat-containing protein [Candidatus Poribacteria bacterium]|nr:dockerin type I repeat-containing protein [Candidatus Poribacteria bacterium]